jgi:hypothetical protein
VNPADKQIAIVVMDWAGTENSSDDVRIPLFF